MAASRRSNCRDKAHGRAVSLSTAAVMSGTRISAVMSACCRCSTPVADAAKVVRSAPSARLARHLIGGLHGQHDPYPQYQQGGRDLRPHLPYAAEPIQDLLS